MFKHKPLMRVTWISPSANTINQIDFIIVKQNRKRNIKSNRSYHSADIGSDHSLVMAKVLLNTKPHKYAKKKLHSFDVSKSIYNTNITQNFEIVIGRSFASLMDLNNIE